MTAIEIHNLQKTYGNVKALDGLNLSVASGVIFGFLGPNGAGKTTTIRLLTGLAKPTGGEARIAGTSISHSHEVAARVGYLPEEPALYPWLTPLELLDHVGRLFGIPAAERAHRSRSLLEKVGLAEAARRRIRGFSRGMRQRLGLAQALVNQPEVLLLDEPASALDPAGRKEILELIGSLRGECTVFMSTHILADVERICDNVGIINKGKLVTEARQADLLARFTIPAYELECTEADHHQLPMLAEHLNELPWVQAVTITNSTARIVVKELDTARRELLRLIAERDVNFRRFEAVTPSLEDVFMRLTNDENGGER